MTAIHTCADSGKRFHRPPRFVCRPPATVLWSAPSHHGPRGERGLPAHNKMAFFTAEAATILLALTLPASIVFGRAANAVSLGLAVLCLATAVIAGLRWPLYRFATWPLGLAIAVAVCWLPAIAMSLSSATSATTVARTVATIAVGVIFAAFLAREQPRRIFAIFITGMLAAEIYACAALYLLPSLLAFRSHGFLQPGLLLKASASAIACALPLLLYGAWRLGGWWRWLGMTCVVLGCAIMLGTGSKSSLAGVMAAGGLTVCVAATKRWRPAVVAAGLLILAGLGGSALAQLPQWAPNQAIGGYRLFAPTWVVDMHRQVIWQFTLERFAERPWFGWGPDVINTAPGAGETIPELGAEYIPAHPHNWMIETLSESGIVGFLPLLAVVLAVAGMAAGRYRRSGNPAWLAWMALWLSYWSAGAFNFSMWNSSWQASGMILAALASCGLRDDRAQP